MFFIVTKNILPSCFSAAAYYNGLQEICKGVYTVKKALEPAKLGSLSLTNRLIRAAHFFFLSRFISPAVNHRADVYGGSTENRSRILLEILDGIRKAAPATATSSPTGKTCSARTSSWPTRRRSAAARSTAVRREKRSSWQERLRCIPSTNCLSDDGIISLSSPQRSITETPRLCAAFLLEKGQKEGSKNGLKDVFLSERCAEGLAGGDRIVVRGLVADDALVCKRDAG